MALRNCAKCGKSYSDTAPACPHCQYIPELFVCEECGSIYRQNENVCKNCGAPISHEHDVPADRESITKTYEAAKKMLEKAETLEVLEPLLSELNAIHRFMDISDTLQACAEKIENEKNAVLMAQTYASANQAAEAAKNHKQWEQLAAVYASLGEYEDAPQKAQECAETAARLKKAQGKKTGITVGILAGIAAVAAICAVLFLVVIPGNHYSTGEELYQQEEYAQAVDAYLAAGDYQDAAQKAEDAQKMADKKAGYQAGETALAAANYEDAIKGFTAAGSFKDAADKLLEANYAAGVAAMGSGDFVKAAAYLDAAKGYSDSVDKLFQCGNDLLQSGNYGEAERIFAGLNNAGYVAYAQGMQTLQDGDYITAATHFANAGVEDSAERMKEANYKQAARLLAENNFADAKSLYSAAGDYQDAATMVYACDLLDAETYWNKGYLNTAKEKYEKLPEGFAYNGVSVDSRLADLKKFSKFVALCGKWQAKGECKIRTRQTHISTGLWDEWTSTYSSPAHYITITCVINGDGTVTMKGKAEYVCYINYSSLSKYLKTVNTSASFTYTGKSVPSSIKASSTETIKISGTKFTMDYSYKNTSTSVNFNYLYRSNWTYSTLKEKY